MAWTAQSNQPKRTYAIIAGLFLSIAMWTKPTAGAFILGVMLLVGLDLIRVRFNWRTWRPRFEVAFFTGLASIPLGAIWYLRNIFYGHDALVFPPEYWLTQAQRSGEHLGWLLLAVGVLTIYLHFQQNHRPNLRNTLIGIVLIAIGVLPSFSYLNPARVDPPASRMLWYEWLSVLAGVSILAYTYWQATKDRWTPQIQDYIEKIAWALLLALPYFVTWFYSYSYHYRLTFAIVALLILPTAIILAEWFTATRILQWKVVTQSIYLLAIIIVAFPGVVSTTINERGELVRFWENQLPDDDAKYTAYNPSIMLVKNALDEYRTTTGQEPIVVAPGDERLPFFFPDMDIRNTGVPISLDDLDDATHYIYGTNARRIYGNAGIPNDENQIVSALNRFDVMQPIIIHRDGTFHYELYELFTEYRFQHVDETGIQPIGARPTDEIRFGDFAWYLGNDLTADFFNNSGSQIIVDYLFQVIEPTDKDFMLYIHLVQPDDDTIYATWDGPISAGEHGYYTTKVWQEDEYVIEKRWIDTYDLPDIPIGDNYRIRFGFYDLQTNERLPVYINGELSGDGYTLEKPAIKVRQ